MPTSNHQITQARGLDALAIRMFAYPRGRLGRLGGKMMLRRGAPAYQWAVEILDLSIDDVLLEVGCGPGGLLALATDLVKEAVGVDASAEMVQLASAVGLDALICSAEDLPFETGKFSVACAMHTIDLWDSIPDALAEIYRVLRADGRITIIVRQLDRSAAPWSPARHGLAPELIEEIEQFLISAGFIELGRRSDVVAGETIVTLSALTGGN